MFNSLSNPTTERWALVTHMSIGFALSASAILGVTGYWFFADTTKGDILQNFDLTDDVINVARLLLAMTMVFTFPMEMQVARHAVHALLFGDGKPITDRQHYTITSTLFAVTLALGLIFEDVGPVLELTGSVSASLLGFILPAIVYVRLEGWQALRTKFREAICKPGLPWVQRVRDGGDVLLIATLLFLGVLSMLVGTATALGL